MGLTSVMISFGYMGFEADFATRYAGT